MRTSYNREDFVSDVYNTQLSSNQSFSDNLTPSISTTSVFHDRLTGEVVDAALSKAQATTPPLLDSSTTQEDSPPMTTKTKVIISGDSIEHYHYEKPLYPSGWVKAKRKKKKPDWEVFARFERWLQPPVRQFRPTTFNKLRRLVRTNFHTDLRFFTLTFNDTNPFPLDDFDQCNYNFKKFIQRLKHTRTDIHYISVPEFQKRGAIHYHVIVDTPYIEHKELERIWGMGFVYVQKLKDTNNISAYISKYLRKNSNDPRFYGKKTFWASRGLRQPTILYGNEALKALEKSKKLRYESSYPSQLNGKVEYKQYDLTSEQKEV